MKKPRKVSQEEIIKLKEMAIAMGWPLGEPLDPQKYKDKIQVQMYRVPKESKD